MFDCYYIEKKLLGYKNYKKKWNLLKDSQAETEVEPLKP